MKPFLAFLILACMAGGARAEMATEKWAIKKNIKTAEKMLADLQAEQIKQSSVPVCGSTVTIETEDYVWPRTETRGGGIISYTIDLNNSPLYSFAETTETYSCDYNVRGEYGIYQLTDIFVKFKKIPKPIDWTDTYLSTSFHLIDNPYYDQPDWSISPLRPPKQIEIMDKNYQIGVNRETGEVCARRRQQ